MAFSVTQSRKASSNGSGNTVTSGSLTLAFSSNLTAGNMIFVAIDGFISTTGQTTLLSDVSKPTDTLGHTYVGVGADVAYNSAVTNSEHLRCFYVANCQAGANTVTVNLDHSCQNLTIIISELSGIVTSSPLDIANSNQNNVAGTSATTTSTNATTNANDVILGAVSTTSGVNPLTYTRGDGASDILDETNGVTNQGVATSYNVKAATGSYAATWTIDSAKYGAQMGAFKLASALTWQELTQPEQPYLERGEVVSY